MRGVYDGTLFWVCPDCGHPFHRFDRSHPFVYAKASSAIANYNAERGRSL